MNLPGLLFEKGLLSAADHAAVEADLARHVPLADALSARHISIADALATASAAYGIPVRTLGDPPADEKAFPYVPLDSARYYGFVPLDVVDGALEIGIVDPDNLEAMDALQFISTRIGMPYKLFLVSRSDFERVLEAYQNLSDEAGKALSEYESAAEASRAESGGDGGTPPATRDATILLVKDGEKQMFKEDAPVTKLVSTIIRYAIDGGASDIHIEPSTEGTRVRFRMDGSLYTSLKLPTKIHDAIVARVKILSSLRLDEKRKPQDGRFSAMFAARHIDFRVSTFPTEYGEKVVMRILDQSQATATLETLGLSAGHLSTLRNLIRAPYGIILIAGPTGSGKSTTLYSMLSELDREIFNVVSLEDPVEYQIAGVSQSQVRPEIDYTFASGLRSILRQDPDIIMVGEIRDKETAALATQAALTGHLVFSTIHTNSAAGALPRLLDMGIDPFLIAPTLLAVVGQRLVRKLCEGAGKPFPITASLKLLLEREFADLSEETRKGLPTFKHFYHASPTSECPSGVRGRTGVFELLKMDSLLEEVVLKNPIEERIYEAARAEGMLTMREDAIIKALAGLIPFEEVNTLGGELFPETDET
ncbi:MAG: GspE/PulE family protein [bacterium]|nr:GspE/PulE family protein [bacterium]